MANQPDKRQQFRFWYPFWGNSTGGTAPRAPVPAPRRTPANQPKRRSPVQTPTPSTNQSQPIKFENSNNASPSASATPSSSSSPSSSPSLSPAKQDQPRRVSHTPSSPLPSSMQSPSRRSPRSDQVKKSTRDESAQGSKQSPRTTPTPSRSPSPSQDLESSPEISNKQGTTQEEQLLDKEPIENTNRPDSKTAEENVDKLTSQANSKVEKENDSKNSDKIEPTSILFYPPIDEKLAGMDIPNINPTENEEETRQESHVPKPQVGLVPSTIEEASETQTKEHDKEIHNESHLDKLITPDHINNQENKNEMLKENTKDITMTPNQVDSPEKIINENQKEKIITGSNSTTTSVHKGIKDGISKLIRKINTENALNHGSKTGTSIITLAGENKGASMYIGHENEGYNSTFTGRAHKPDESSAMSSKGTIRTNDIEIEKDSRLSANVNSNVQSINNSMLQDSRCDTRDPGVHLKFLGGTKKREAEASN